jgi:hypothetical protein
LMIACLYIVSFSGSLWHVSWHIPSGADG